MLLGYFFLPTSPEEKLPVPDYRTIENNRISQPSPDLLETLYICQQRQEWYREFSLLVKEDSYSFVGSATLNDDPVVIAEIISATLGFNIENRRNVTTWKDALRLFITLTDTAGIMTMVSGVVGSNTHRKLAYEEFRGFALSDDRAPLVFINGSDTKSAQMFTLAHELAHIWLGKTGVSDQAPASVPTNDTEKWCNSVAAELLVPIEVFRAAYTASNALPDEIAHLARFFKVSTLVIIRRLHDSGFITWQRYKEIYDEELTRFLEMKKGAGGNYYSTQPARVSKRFARALIMSALEGQALYRDALQLLGMKKMSTFNELSARLGVM